MLGDNIVLAIRSVNLIHTNKVRMLHSSYYLDLLSAKRFELVDVDKVVGNASSLSDKDRVRVFEC